MQRDPMLLTIGQLAERAGVSVRTLHHYDSIGLLSPSARTTGGARRYGPHDIVRLHRVQALKLMGYSLPDIRSALDDPAVSPLELIERQIALLEDKARHARRASGALRHLAEQLSQHGSAPGAQWLDSLELTTLYQQHLDDEQLELLRQRELASGGRLEARWRRLVAQVQQAMSEGIAPDRAAAKSLGWRWARLVIARTGNDPALAASLRSLHDGDARAQQVAGIGPPVFEWIGQALAHARGDLFARHLAPGEVQAVVQRQLQTMAHMTAWPALVGDVREQMLRGVAADAPAMRELALRWTALVRDSLSGGDALLEAKLRAAFAAEPGLRLGVGVTAPLLVYVAQALLSLEPATE